MHAGWQLPPTWIGGKAPWLRRFGPRLLASVVAAMSLGSGLSLALRHLSDRHGISHVHGAWMGLADLAAHGQWYPPPFDGTHYAGTRFMPLGIGVLALFRGALGDPLLGSKVAALITTALLLVTLGVALTRSGLSRSAAIAGASLVLLTAPGVYGLTAYRGDVLPVALQLLALLLVERSNGGWRRVAGAGVLAGAAVLAKLSALWALGAIGLFLLLTPRRLVPFVAGALLTLGVGLGGTELISGGHFFENLRALSGSGLGSFAGAPGRLHYLWVEAGLASWVLLPAVALGFWRTVVTGKLELAQLAFLIASALVVVILVDAGTYANHLLDVVVLSVLLAGRALATLHAEGDEAARVLFLGTVLFGAFAGFDRAVADELRARSGLSRDPLAEVVTGAGPYLSEDATIPVVRGERPLVLDAWMFLRYAARHPEAEAHLEGLIEARALTHVVLLRDPQGPGAEEWYRVQAFGPRIIAAIQRNYHLATVVEGYHVYRPNPAPLDAPTE